MEYGSKQFWAFDFLPLVWMAVILALSSIPGRHIPASWIFHHAGHLTEYSVLGFLMARALAQHESKPDVLTLSFFSVLLAFLFGGLDEFRQSFVPGRTCSLITVLFDGAYAVLGVSLYDLIVFIPRKKKSTEHF